MLGVSLMDRRCITGPRFDKASNISRFKWLKLAIFVEEPSLSGGYEPLLTDALKQVAGRARHKILSAVNGKRPMMMMDA